MGRKSPMTRDAPGMATTRLFLRTRNECDAVASTVRPLVVSTVSITPLAGCRDTWVTFVHETVPTGETPIHVRLSTETTSC